MGDQTSRGGHDEAAFARRAARHAAWRTRRAVTVTADRLRRGDRTVITTPVAGLRFGNWLYLWLRAHARSAEGLPTRVLFAPGMELWLEAFPRLRQLTVQQAAVRFHDRREWDHAFRFQRFGVDFSGEQVDAFVRDDLAPWIDADGPGTVVVNVRRGDYYEHEGFRDMYAFDQAGYLRAALELSGDADRILVVSDDALWCRANLDGLLRRFASSVDYAEPDPLANFRAVAAAARVIGTNSTFSYWAAHVSTVLHHDAQIVVPRFHARLDVGTDGYQLDPRWHAVEGFH